MHFDRRELLKCSAAFGFATQQPAPARADVSFDPVPGTWRSFEVITRVEIAGSAAATQAWIPLPSVGANDWIKPEGNRWTTNGAAEVAQDTRYRTQMLHVTWKETEKAPFAEVTSTVSIQDRSVDLFKPASSPVELSQAERRFNSAGTELIPVDGIVKRTSDKITAGKTTEVEKVHAIYDWIVANTYRDAKVRGCGNGNVVSMLKSGNLGGKCADINALFVGLTRAAGIPARDVYGIRVAPSRFGYKSLGAKGTVVTGAQHCRAEVFLTGYGWVAIDPADVRKVMLEEPPTNLPSDNPKVVAARHTLFGAWEGNWMAYNFAHDLVLPGSSGPKIAFLMYPQGEDGNGRLDCLDAAAFRYGIKAKEITAT